MEENSYCYKISHLISFKLEKKKKKLIWENK